MGCSDTSFSLIPVGVFAFWFAIAAEIIVHLHIKSLATSDDPTTSDPEDDRSTASKKPRFDAVFCTPNASYSLRARRLGITTCLLIPIAIASGFRIALFEDAGGCDDMFMLIFFGIIPLCLAGCAWLRALTDCLLMRWGKGLGYVYCSNCTERCKAAQKKRKMTPLEGVCVEGDVKWPILLPVSLAVVPVMFLTRWGVLCMMRKNLNLKKDIEMRKSEAGEERTRLIDYVDGE